MIVYQADKQQFLNDNDDRDIELVIHQNYQSVTGRSVAASELRSWRESLGYMAKVLRDEEIPNETTVAVEFHIPQSSKRIDVLLTGHDENQEKTIVILELKQWERAEKTNRDAMVTTYIGGAKREVVHPSYQAWSYAALLEGFNSAIYENNIHLRPCVYLHNYVKDDVIGNSHYQSYIDRAPVFLKGESERRLLREFIKTHIKAGDSKTILFEVENGKIKPSKALADSLINLMRGKPEFVLIDDQKAVYEAALAGGGTATANKPKTLIIEGGPGTGKSVIAINLLVALTSKGLVCKYVSKNAAPRAVYEAKLTGTMKKTAIGNLFSGSGAFMEAPKDFFDVLIVDEAHRLNEKSGFYGTDGENQIKEIINSAKCTIFFIDEDQRVTLKDIGSKSAIKEFAVNKGALIEEYSLSAQFRCSGADGYIAWLDEVLDIRPTANTHLSKAEFDFRVFDSPVELQAVIETKNFENKARMVAGYCWEWNSKNNPSAYDIVIGENYKKRWNLGSDGSLWIIAPNSVSEIGCVHTCQGLELDYIGVIVGPDLIVRNRKVYTAPEERARQDQSIKGYKALRRLDPAKAAYDTDLIIKNTYRTLMTRGMKGCYIYCTDAETRDYFKQRLAS